MLRSLVASFFLASVFCSPSFGQVKAGGQAAPMLPYSVTAPAVFDDPSIEFEVSPIDFGVRVNLSQSKTVSKTSYFGTSKSISKFTSTESIQKRVQGFKSSTGLKINSQISPFGIVEGPKAPNGSPFSLSGGFDHSSSESYSKTNTFTDTELRNTGPSVVSVGGIVVNVVAIDPDGVNPPEVIATTCLSTKHLIVDRTINLEPIAAPSPANGSAAVRVNGRASGVASGAINNSGSFCDESQAQFTIAPELNNLGPTKIAFNLDGLRTDKIQSLMDRGRVLFSDVSQLSTRIGEREIDSSMLRQLALARGIRIRVLYPDNAMIERFVDPLKVGNVRHLRTVLNALQIGEAKVAKDAKGRLRLSRIGNYVF